MNEIRDQGLAGARPSGGSINALIAVMVLAAGSAFGQARVTINTRHFCGTSNNSPVIVALASEQPFTSGTNFVFGTPRTLTPTNSVAVVDLLPATYTLTFGSAAKAATIHVPTETGSYNAIDLVVRGVTPIITIVTNVVNVTSNIFETNVVYTLLVENTNYVFAVGSSNTILFWISWDGVAHGDVSGMTNLPPVDGSKLVDGTVTASKMDPTLDAEYRASASTDIDGTNVVSGRISPARLGTGTANAENVLHGDGAWGPASSNSFDIFLVTVTSNNTTQVLWTNTVAQNSSLRIGNLYAHASGSTVKYAQTLSDSLFWRDLGSVQPIGTNLTAAIGSGVSWAVTTNATSGEVVIAVTGSSSDNVSWKIFGWSKSSTNGLPQAIELSGVSSGTPEATSATLTWTTSGGADSTVHYGTTASYGSTSTTAENVTSHSVTITGLTAGTTYHYQVASTNAYGVGAASEDGTFTTAAASSTLTDGLVASWTMDESGSVTRTDSGPNAFTATVSGTVDSIAGAVNNGASFTNNNSNILTVSDNDGFSAIGGKSLTIAGWVKLSATNTVQCLVSKYATSSGQMEWIVYWHGTRNSWLFNVYTNGASAGVVSLSPPTNGVQTATWIGWVAQIDATNMVSKFRYKVTGGDVQPWATSGTYAGFGPAGTGTNTTTSVRFGQTLATAAPLNGVLDNVTFANRLWTDVETTNFLSTPTQYPF